MRDVCQFGDSAVFTFKSRSSRSFIVLGMQLYSVAYCQECASYSGFFSLSSSWLFSNITSIVSQPRVEMGFVNCSQAIDEAHSTWSGSRPRQDL